MSDEKREAVERAAGEVVAQYLKLSDDDRDALCEDAPEFAAAVLELMGAVDPAAYEKYARRVARAGGK